MAQATFGIHMDETRENRIPFEISAPANHTREQAISAFWEMRKIIIGIYKIDKLFP